GLPGAAPSVVGGLTPNDPGCIVVPFGPGTDDAPAPVPVVPGLVAPPLAPAPDDEAPAPAAPPPPAEPPLCAAAIAMPPSRAAVASMVECSRFDDMTNPARASPITGQRRRWDGVPRVRVPQRRKGRAHRRGSWQRAPRFAGPQAGGSAACRGAKAVLRRDTGLRTAAGLYRQHALPVRRASAAPGSFKASRDS